MIQIIDEGRLIRIIDGSQSELYSKSSISVVYAGKINFYCENKLIRQVEDYGQVSFPEASSNSDLVKQIKKILNEDGAYDGRKMLIGNVREKFRDEFFSFDTDENWVVTQLGTGMTISLGGMASGSRYLAVSSGVTTDQETIILSRKIFTMPVRVVAAISLSQRIANTECYYEVVEVDENGNIVEDTSLGATYNSRNTRNCAGIKWDGTTASNAIYYNRAGGTSEMVSASVSFGTNSSNATGAGPNFMPAFMFDLALATESIIFQGNAVDSSSGGTYYKRSQCVPESDKLYAIRIRIKNLSVAPASSTDMRIHFVRVLDSTRVSVDFAQIAGRADAQNAPLVQASISGTPAVTISGTPAVTISGTPAVTASISSTPTLFAETTTNLAANATFTGTSRDAGATNTMRRFVAIAWAAQSGTLRLEMSTDGTTWRPATDNVSVAAGVGVTLEIPVVSRYTRVVYVNGATAQTGFMINSAYHKV